MRLSLSSNVMCAAMKKTARRVKGKLQLKDCEREPCPPVFGPLLNLIRYSLRTRRHSAAQPCSRELRRLSKHPSIQVSAKGVLAMISENFPFNEASLAELDTPEFAGEWPPLDAAWWNGPRAAGDRSLCGGRFANRLESLKKTSRQTRDALQKTVWWQSCRAGAGTRLAQSNMPRWRAARS